MIKSLGFLTLFSVLCCAGTSLGQASLTPSGYTQNFDSMGTSGTTPPTGWRHFVATFGSNTTWGSSISASGSNSVATMAVTTAGTTLSATTTPSSNTANGYNAAASAGNTSDRVLATAPTSIAGAFVQLQLRNDSGADLVGGSILTVAFDTIRYTAVSSANELPGYWLFISLDGSTWTNVTPNPTITTVPNSTGTTTTSLNYTLTGAWASASSIYLRWVDDNANQTSPDQIIGLNNVSITAAGGNPNGSCCFADGSCTTTTTGVCAGGTFTSGGVCVPNSCPQPPQGSCCAVDGSCTITIQSACGTGSWTNAGTCTPNTCPVLVASLTTGGYSENFDSMTQSGTTPPGGWQCRFLSGSHDVFSYAGSLASITTTFLPSSTPTAINAGTGSSSLTTNNTLIALTQPTTQGSGSQCYNAGLTASANDRCLASAATGVAAIELQLALRNDTGTPLTALTIGYDIRRFRTTTSNNSAYNSSPYVGVEELPGYQLFVSTDNGASFANVAEFNPTLTGPGGVIVPNSIGATLVLPDLVSLPAAVAPGGTIILRWVDDNAQSPSPDQFIGLDNVLVSVADLSELGACCRADGSCIYALSDDTCIGGIFRGVGTTCQPNTCPQPPSGSCCAADGSCSVTTQANCSTLWTLDGSCTPNICPGPLSACCAADGSCSLVAQGQCTGFSVPGTCTTALCRQPADMRLCAFGDYGIDGGNQDAVASRMKTFNPAFLVTTGDNSYFTSNAISNFDNTQAKYYREFIKITNPSSAYFGQGSAVNNFFPVMGNHDMDIGGGASAAIPYWNAYWELPGNERYYTLSRGPIDFFMLSSDPREPDGRAVNSTQYTWFINAYNASTAKYKIVVFHHPAQTSVSGHGPDTTMRTWNFQNLPGITAVLSGHNHNMERIEFGGIPWYVTGAGGNSLYSISSVDPNSVFRNDTQWGFLLIDANESNITFRFVNAAGNILDTRVVNAATGACCTGTACAVTSSAGCSGSFKGSGTVCGPLGNPTTCCIANYNQIDGVNFQDIFDYLNAWFNNAPSADINASGGVDFQDIFDFLNAWFAGC